MGFVASPPLMTKLYRTFFDALLDDEGLFEEK